MLRLRAELPDGYVAEVFRGFQGLLHKDVSSLLEMIQLSTCRSYTEYVESSSK